VLEFVLVLAVLAVAVWLVTGPLREARSERADDRVRRARADVEELQARREAKYREISDAELDHRVGKLSEEEWRAQDRALRAEAIEILRRLDEARARAGAGAGAG
jgi:outer membrane murein-binding lipoprotein Lpp